MFQSDEVDARLAELAAKQFENEGDAFAALAAATATINGELTAQMGLVAGSSALRRNDLDRRLEQWLRRLTEIARSVAETVRAAGYSISVGLPAGVSVGINFDFTR